MKEAAVEHLKSCNDKKAIAAYQKKIAEDKEKERTQAKAVETQEDVMAFKTWEHNGRQVRIRIVCRKTSLPFIFAFRLANSGC